MQGTKIALCYLVIGLCLVLTGLDAVTEEPECFSKFDYDYKLMHLVVNVERQLTDLTATTDRLKTEIASLDTSYKDVREKLDAEMYKTEQMEKRIKTMSDRLHEYITEADSVPSWSPWTEWSACFMNCTGPSGGRQQTRTRTARGSNAEENESRPCNAVQFAGCVKTSSNDADEYAVVYDYTDMIAQAACTAVGEKHVRAVRRHCRGGVRTTCTEVCRDVGTTCFNALHVYGGQPVPKRGETGTKGPMVYKYNSCTGRGCGPNFCCCESN